MSDGQESLAFLFPGQGSQSVGMLAEAAREFKVVADTFSEASDALGYDLWRVASEDPENQLNLTEYTQPALLTASVALYRAWRESGGEEPAVMAGHSLGELSAFCCAETLTLEDAVRVVRERGRAMQSAVPVGEGAMAAVLGLDDDTVVASCRELSGNDAVVEAVNFNAPGQVVIAGHTALVDQAIETLRDAGAKRAMKLAVSAPFHTSLMSPASDHLATVLEGIELRAPRVPVVQNVRAAVESSVADISTMLVRQVSAPVRWTECVATVIGMGANRAMECGPGKVLGGLLKRIDRSVSCQYLESPSALRDALGEAA